MAFSQAPFSFLHLYDLTDNIIHQSLARFLLLLHKKNSYIYNQHKN